VIGIHTRSQLALLLAKQRFNADRWRRIVCSLDDDGNNTKRFPGLPKVTRGDHRYFEWLCRYYGRVGRGLFDALPNLCCPWMSARRDGEHISRLPKVRPAIRSIGIDSLAALDLEWASKRIREAEYLAGLKHPTGMFPMRAHCQSITLACLSLERYVWLEIV
jgi:hypothetical protein